MEIYTFLYEEEYELAYFVKYIKKKYKVTINDKEYYAYTIGIFNDKWVEKYFNYVGKYDKVLSPFYDNASVVIRKSKYKELTMIKNNDNITTAMLYDIKISDLLNMTQG